MPGRPPWSQPGTQGGGQTIAVNDRPSVKVVDFSQTVNVAAGSVEKTEVYPPDGAKWDVRAMRINIASDPDWAATTPAHEVKVRAAGSLPDMVYGASGETERLRFDKGYWVVANSDKRPSDQTAARLAEQTLTATDNQPVTFDYRVYSETGAPQENERNYKILVEETTY